MDQKEIQEKEMHKANHVESQIFISIVLAVAKLYLTFLLY